MPKDDKRGKSFWDDREVTETGLLRKPEKQPSDKPAATGSSGGAVTSTHQLYLQFFNGVERRAPIEKVRLLESKISELQKISINLTAVRFKISQFLSQYSGMKELWERKLRERERK